MSWHSCSLGTALQHLCIAGIAHADGTCMSLVAMVAKPSSHSVSQIGRSWTGTMSLPNKRAANPLKSREGRSCEVGLPIYIPIPTYFTGNREPFSSGRCFWVSESVLYFLVPRSYCFRKEILRISYWLFYYPRKTR